ncbi:MAG: FAD-dependent oxidoreductase, partial [Myxococcota bacterium]
RIRFPIEIVKAVRDACGPDFILIYRLSMLDLVDQGSTWDEVVELAVKIEAAGASIINTGIGWHEARVPTIATLVPRRAFSWVTHRLMGEVSLPLVTSNRINMPKVAEQVLADGHADMISMARPFLADPEWMNKAAEGREREINTCIACNQACLDHGFENKRASCLVNPLACYESELSVHPIKRRRRIAVVGAGPAGLSFACTAAERGHDVVLFDKATQIGGQFNMARQVPGKEEFKETLRYFTTRIAKAGVELHLETEAKVDMLVEQSFDAIVLATGVVPRALTLPGIDHPKVLSYVDVLQEHKPVGERVAIIGAGGIGFDVAEYLLHADHNPSDNIASFMAHWGVDMAHATRGGLMSPEEQPPERHITLCQRSKGKLGARLGKTTGWIHRRSLKKASVEMLSECRYTRIDDRGLHLTVEGQPRVLEVDHVVVCAGQVPLRALEAPLTSRGMTVHRIGGADVAAELDAKRAIDQGMRLAISL